MNFFLVYTHTAGDDHVTTALVYTNEAEALDAYADVALNGAANVRLFVGTQQTVQLTARRVDEPLKPITGPRYASTPKKRVKHDDSAVAPAAKTKKKRKRKYNPKRVAKAPAVHRAREALRSFLSRQTEPVPVKRLLTIPGHKITAVYHALAVMRRRHEVTRTVEGGRAFYIGKAKGK